MIQIKNNYNDAIQIMAESSNRLIDEGIPLWNPIDFVNGNILKTNRKNDFYTAYVKNEAVASFILKWQDPDLWPESLHDSGFLHKLCIRKKFAGLGIASHIFEWSKNQIKMKNRHYLRLDCDANRIKLCNFYENHGFIFVKRKTINDFDTAFF